MYTVFYDLETSDRFRIGQILSFSFICVDDDFKLVDEFSDIIKISRLQLPSPQAILINRINVIDHNQRATLCERDAMREIAKFIHRQIERAPDKLCFVGFNSSRFDLPFLRTSLIRNGVEPYFRGRLLYRDLFHCVRKLAVSEAAFPRVSGASFADDYDQQNGQRMSLSLESVCRGLGILHEAQTHDAREDVLLSIRLAETLRQQFAMDIRHYEAYEVRSLHGSVRSGKVYASLNPNYNLDESNRAQVTPMTLLDCDHRYALWIDIDRFQSGDGRASVRWYSQTNSQFISDCRELTDPRLTLRAKESLQELKAVNLKNYFKRSTCDIEEDIYRLDISMIDLLAAAIWRGERSNLDKVAGKDLKIVLLRNDLANYSWGGEQDDIVRELLRKYAIYRYGGDIQVERFSEDKGATANSELDYSHPTFKDLLSSIEGKLAQDMSPGDRELLEVLKNFYLSSDIYQIAADALLA